MTTRKLDRIEIREATNGWIVTEVSMMERTRVESLALNERMLLKKIQALTRAEPTT